MTGRRPERLGAELDALCDRVARGQGGAEGRLERAQHAAVARGEVEHAFDLLATVGQHRQLDRAEGLLPAGNRAPACTRTWVAGRDLPATSSERSVQELAAPSDVQLLRSGQRAGKR